MARYVKTFNERHPWVLRTVVIACLAAAGVMAIYAYG